MKLKYSSKFTKESSEELGKTHKRPKLKMIDSLSPTSKKYAELVGEVEKNEKKLEELKRKRQKLTTGKSMTF